MFETIRTDPAMFPAVRVAPDAGTIVWPNGADLAPTPSTPTGPRPG